MKKNNFSPNPKYNQSINHSAIPTMTLERARTTKLQLFPFTGVKTSLPIFTQGEGSVRGDQDEMGWGSLYTHNRTPDPKNSTSAHPSLRNTLPFDWQPPCVAAAPDSPAAPDFLKKTSALSDVTPPRYRCLFWDQAQSQDQFETQVNDQDRDLK